MAAPAGQLTSGVRPGATRGGIGAAHAAREDPAGEPARPGPTPRRGKPSAKRPATPKPASTPKPGTRSPGRASPSPPKTKPKPKPEQPGGQATEPAPAAAAAGDDEAPAQAPAQAQGPVFDRTKFAGKSSDAGAAVLVLFAYPLAFNLVKGGPAQMWGWIKAKFMNQPYSAAPDTSGVGTPPSKIPGAYHGHKPSLGKKK